eukprot:TRINITY_DN14642_c1_g4_i2.p1 TRINITY_DN14642_c1_g4~~TRINITY_DN14642_c1_g4_i2.p1  ORF type:complete len:465 (+),score=76.16 TRINITY_DN14642_c1_g4_i2:125-1519(+)
MPTTFGALGHMLDLRDSAELLHGTGGKRVEGYAQKLKRTMLGTSLGRDEVASLMVTAGTYCASSTVYFPAHPPQSRALRSPQRAPLPPTQVRMDPRSFATCLPPAPLRAQPRSWVKVLKRRAKLAMAAQDAFPNPSPPMPDSDSHPTSPPPTPPAARGGPAPTNRLRRDAELGAEALSAAGSWHGRQLVLLSSRAGRPPRNQMLPPGRGGATACSPDHRAPPGKRLGKPKAQPIQWPPAQPPRRPRHSGMDDLLPPPVTGPGAFYWGARPTADPPSGTPREQQRRLPTPPTIAAPAAPAPAPSQGGDGASQGAAPEAAQPEAPAEPTPPLPAPQPRQDQQQQTGAAPDFTGLRCALASQRGAEGGRLRLSTRLRRAVSAAHRRATEAGAGAAGKLHPDPLFPVRHRAAARGAASAQPGDRAAASGGYSLPAPGRERPRTAAAAHPADHTWDVPVLPPAACKPKV